MQLLHVILVAVVMWIGYRYIQAHEALAKEVRQLRTQQQGAHTTTKRPLDDTSSIKTALINMLNMAM